MWFQRNTRLKNLNDVCPVGSGLPSLRHTRWGRVCTAQLHFVHEQADGYTAIVAENRFWSWQRSFTEDAPAVVSSKALFVVREWVPRRRGPHCQGWLPFGPAFLNAIGQLHAEYRRDWKPHALRAIKKFERSGCSIRLGMIDDVRALYKVSQVPKALQERFLAVLDRHLKVHPESIEILVAEQNGIPAACLVAGNCEEIKQSEYLIGAFHPAYAKIGGMVGLVDEWYRRSLARGYTAVNFGLIDAPHPMPLFGGSGYSLFKTYFGVQRVWFPGSLWKISRNI